MPLGQRIAHVLLPKRRLSIRDLTGELLVGTEDVLPKVEAGCAPASLPALVGHVSHAYCTLVTGAGEYLVHALTRDTESTGELRLIGARLVRSQQGATEVAPGFVEALKSIERFLVGVFH